MLLRRVSKDETRVAGLGAAAPGLVLLRVLLPLETREFVLIEALGGARSARICTTAINHSFSRKRGVVVRA
jgi:hypothetical protein